MSTPLVICVAPNGARRGRSEHAALPLTIEETVAEAERCVVAGASALHLHVRDAQGAHTLDADQYRKALARLRERTPSLLVQVTTEAVGRYGPAEQRAVVHAVHPEAVSVALREMLPEHSETREAREFYHWARAEGIAVQHILYSAEETERLVDLARLQVIPAPAAALFVLGRHVSAEAWEPFSLVHWLARWPREWPWMVCGFGVQEALLASAAIGLDGHVRVGFENNLQLPDGRLAEHSAQNVRLTAQQARNAGRALADRGVARRVLGAWPA